MSEINCYEIDFYYEKGHRELGVAFEAKSDYQAVRHVQREFHGKMQQNYIRERCGFHPEECDFVNAVLFASDGMRIPVACFTVVRNMQPIAGWVNDPAVECFRWNAFKNEKLEEE